MVNYSQLHSSIVISTNLLEFKDNYNGHQNMNTFKYKLLINTYHETLNLSSFRPFIPSTCIEINTINVGFFYIESLLELLIFFLIYKINLFFHIIHIHHLSIMHLYIDVSISCIFTFIDIYWKHIWTLATLIRPVLCILRCILVSIELVLYRQNTEVLYCWVYFILYYHLRMPFIYIYLLITSDELYMFKLKLRPCCVLVLERQGYPE